MTDLLDPNWRGWVLLYRVSTPPEQRAYVIFALQETTLKEVVQVGGTLWGIEQLFEAVRGEVGLDHDEVRSWTGWYRHMELARWALALLVVLQEETVAMEALKKNLQPAPKPASLAAFKAHRGFASP